ncbi:MAG: phytoene/squalene synthase family protein [Pseudomonadota bacterium]
MSQWENVMQKHAKSFYLASLFFPKHLLPRVKALYALCRWLDDAVDEAPNEQIARKRLQEIGDDLKQESPKMAVNAYYRENQLDIGYMQDLMEGAIDDLSLVRIKNETELIRYSYKVAGTVGLAMFDLMNVPNPRARAHAVDLGIAMQITNICRDVKEDLERDRVYIPETLLKKHNITIEQLREGDYSAEQIQGVTFDMLQLADQYYQSAQYAFPEIPFRTRGAIIIASQLYRAIGLKLLREGGNPMLGRTYLKKPEKVFVLLKAFWCWGLSSFSKKTTDHKENLHHGLESWQSLRGFLH